MEVHCGQIRRQRGKLPCLDLVVVSEARSIWSDPREAYRTLQAEGPEPAIDALGRN
jgi:hypothetical protein